MNEEEIRKIAKEEFMNNVMKQLNSSLIFTYIQNLENQLQQKENIIKEVREKLNTQLAFTSSYQLNYQSSMNIIEEAKSILDKEVIKSEWSTDEI